MDEAFIREIRERLDALDKYVRALSDKVDGLDSMIFDEVLNPLEEHFKSIDYNTKLNDFKDRTYDKLDPYIDRLKAIEGDEFDVYKQAYDEYNSMGDDKMPEEEFIDLLTNQLDDQLNKIREALGVAPDTPITIEDNGEGEEPVITVEESAVEETPEEPLVEEVTEEVGVDISEQPEVEDEVTAYEKELEAYLPKKKK